MFRCLIEVKDGRWAAAGVRLLGHPFPLEGAGKENAVIIAISEAFDETPTTRAPHYFFTHGGLTALSPSSIEHSTNPACRTPA
jgi:hypothetical protein